MAKLLKNRSDNDIKNKFYSMARKQQRLQKKVAEAIYGEIAWTKEMALEIDAVGLAAEAENQPMTERGRSHRP